MQYLRKQDIIRLIDSHQKEMIPEHFLFLKHVLESFKDDMIFAEDLAEQIKKDVCFFYNLFHGNIEKTEGVELQPLFNNPIFKNGGNFIADIKEMIPVIFGFDQDFTQEVTVLLPDRVRNQLNNG
jgi:hypothetical protein